MPSATYADWTFTNLGPLTTTYTAPASCSTATDRVAFALATRPDAVIYFPSCEPLKYSDCIPSGNAIDEMPTTTDSEPTASSKVFRYYSPGLVCPADWATVGVAAKASDGSVSATGIFSGSPSQATARPMNFVEPYPNALLNGMEAGETAVACCPSNWDADELGRCTSRLPSTSYIPTAVCARLNHVGKSTESTRTLSLYGQLTTVTEQSYQVTATTTVSTTFGPSSATFLLAITGLPMAMLVHRESDKASNPASSVRPPWSGTAGLWSVFCLALAFLAGLGIMTPL